MDEVLEKEKREKKEKKKIIEDNKAKIKRKKIWKKTG